MGLEKLIRVRWSLHAKVRSWTGAHSPGVENAGACKCQADHVNEQNVIVRTRKGRVQDPWEPGHARPSRWAGQLLFYKMCVSGC